MAKFSVSIDWPSDLGVFEQAIYLNRFFSDFFLYCAIFLLLYTPNVLSRWFAYAIVAAFVLVYLVQAQSFAVSGGFIPSIALENAQHIDFLDLDQHIFALVIWGLILLVVFRSLVKNTHEIPELKARLLVTMALLIASVLTKNDRDWLSEQTFNQRHEFYNSGRPGIPRESPISELLKSIDEYREYLDREKWVQNAATQMTEEGARIALKYKLPYAEISHDYALMQQGGELSPIGFLDRAETTQSPNVIVFFIEGVSARAMQPYSEHFPGLWPNMAKFSETASRVDNYYSHAFATYRALGGQLCSIYPVGRLLKQTRYHCLAHELKAHDYDTRFMVSQGLANTDLDDIAKLSGFDEVDGAEQLVPLLSLPSKKISKTVTDKQLIKGLVERLKRREKNEDKPFAIAVYNFETHTGVRLIEDTTRYQSEKRQSVTTLNTFHNFDQAFGDFWQYFKQSSLFDNTVVVVTSDHATYPSREYSDLMKDSEGYVPVFADQIPLLIYHPNGRSKQAIDANRATSINFTPTVLHLLGLNSRVNAFIGASLFDGDKSYPLPVASRGAVMWARSEVGHWQKISSANRDKLDLDFLPAGAYFDYIEFTQSLERSNRLIDEKRFKDLYQSDH